MLEELRVTELGVIADLTLVLGPGMTALTGETGAGKTLVVEAIELLLGSRADSVLVRPGASAAIVEGRFGDAGGAGGGGDGHGAGGGNGAGAVGGAGEACGAADAGDAGESGEAGDDLVLARVVPAAGRSRAYVNGRMAPASALEDAAGRLVDLHGQHSHQSLLVPSVQRRGLDRFGSIDLGPVEMARQRLRSLDDALAGLGGDGRARVRELDLLRFQVSELDDARLEDVNEETELGTAEDWLADATAHREAAAAAVEALSGDGAVIDGLGGVVSGLTGRAPFAVTHERLRALAVELDDAAQELRALAESLEDDPERLGRIRERRQLLRSLRRKYGDELTDVIVFREQARRRLEELTTYEARAAAIERERAEAEAQLATAEEGLGRARRKAAPKFATAVEKQLHDLAMPRARFEVRVGADLAGDDVTWLLGGNPGEPTLPLARVASGGELARTMLALRLVLGSTGGLLEPIPSRTLVFDEVDAGIGGEAAVAVGRALAEVSRHHQVLVVTHLPQVAAFADQQIVVEKREVKSRTVAGARTLSADERVVELSRMLSGQPDSATARRHAKELLAFAHR